MKNLNRLSVFGLESLEELLFDNQTIYKYLIRFFNLKFSSENSLKLGGAKKFSVGQHLFQGAGGMLAFTLLKKNQACECHSIEPIFRME